MNYLTLDKIDAYKISDELSDVVWDEVMSWDKFEKWSVGQQLVKSMDSISANNAEGFGRYHKKDKIKFYRYSFGSLKETQSWIDKAKRRNLINLEKALEIESALDKLPKSLNYLIKYTNEKLKY